MGRTGLGFLALVTALAASPAFAGGGRGAAGIARSGSGPDISVKSAKITSVRGSTFEVTTELKGRGQRHEVAIFYVKGFKTEQLWKGQAKFGVGANGARFSKSVNVGRRNMDGAKLKVVATACKTKSKCRKSAKVEGGDLVIRPGRFITEGSERFFEFDVENKGPAKSKACKIEIEVNNRRVKTIDLPRVANGQKKKFTYKYTSAQRRKGAKVKLRCNDLANTGNIKSVRLK